jgi:hypothetical protein
MQFFQYAYIIFVIHGSVLMGVAPSSLEEFY